MCGCDYCTDLRFIEPAKDVYVDDGKGNLVNWLKEAREKKRFIEAVFKDGVVYGFYVIDCCPKCFYKFTESDYNKFE